MSWESTHRRWAALREVAAAAEFSREIPWRPEYAELFGDREGLLAALRYRYDLAAQAQLDPDLPMEAYQERERVLAGRDEGIRRLLRRRPLDGHDDRSVDDRELSRAIA
jgi:hypothetical protein